MRSMFNLLNQSRRTLFAMLVVVALSAVMSSVANAQAGDGVTLPPDFAYTHDYPALLPQADSTATLSIHYFKTEGISNDERLTFEIAIEDSLVCTAFETPDAADFRYVSFRKKRLLSPSEQKRLIRSLAQSRLYQKHDGVPIASFSGSGREVFLIRREDSVIFGGMAWSTVGTDDSPPQSDVERRVTSTIGGNYDLFIREIKSLFPELPHLMSEGCR